MASNGCRHHKLYVVGSKLLSLLELLLHLKFRPLNWNSINMPVGCRVSYWWQPGYSCCARVIHKLLLHCARVGSMIQGLSPQMLLSTGSLCDRNIFSTFSQGMLVTAARYQWRGIDDHQWCDVPGLRAWKHEHEETELTCYVIDHNNFCMYCMSAYNRGSDGGFSRQGLQMHACTRKVVDMQLTWYGGQSKASNYNDGECDVCIVNKPHVVRAVCCTAHFKAISIASASYVHLNYCQYYSAWE